MVREPLLPLLSQISCFVATVFNRGIADAENLDRLAGQFALWSATKEAAFLHGRTAGSTWDVEELAKGEIRKKIDEDFYFLRGTIAGVERGMMP